MKKAFPYLVILCLVVAGILLVYLESQALPAMCEMVQIYCTSTCGGTFSLGDPMHPDECYDYEGVTYCWFTCSSTHPEWLFCGWSNPTYGQCVL